VTPAEGVRRLAREERGGVLVMFAVWLPVLMLFMTFVVDVGNWFEHKRHLQLQADAGALAGGTAFTFPCSDADIDDVARQYAGDPTHDAPYNLQVAPTDQENVHMLINSSQFWNEGGTNYSDGGSPCNSMTVDVKMTEADLPWFFGLDFVPAINARARVQLERLTRMRGALPLGVPDPSPSIARAFFVDEGSCTNSGCRVIASTPLTRTGSANGLSIWDNSAAPLSVPIDASRIGVRIALGGASSTTCGGLMVECYDLSSSQGIVAVRGWSSSGSGAQPNPPLARDVKLFTGSCDDPYFAAPASTCTIGVRATVDFGSLSTDAAKLSAVVGGTTYPLEYEAATGTWVSPATAMIPVPPAAGRVPVELTWEETTGTVSGNACTATGANRCKGTFGVVHGAFTASEAFSGPIKVAQVWESGAFWANSFEIGTTHSLVVRIGFAGSLQNAASVNDPLVALRVAGSQNQSVDCDPNLANLRDEIANGCAPEYRINAGTPCPATATVLWNQPQPWQCVAAQTGGAIGQVSQGMQQRILGGATTCTSPNNWSSFPDLPSDDRRIVPVFLTPFGSFSGSGNTVVEVRNFASFYVTGWSGSPCPGDDPVPGNGYIVGHFIKFVQGINNGGSDGDLCDQSAFGSCIPVLTE
jgi:hypothetical protein